MVVVTSWMRKLPKIDRHRIVGVRVMTRVFSEVHTPVDVVYIVAGRGVLLAPFSFCLLGDFVLVV